MLQCFALFSILAAVYAWPGMKSKDKATEDYIGPACTVGAHNWHPDSGPCPNMEQPPAPTPFSGNSHIWPNQFVVDWEFIFVKDDTDEPPYNPLPKTPYNITTGRTYYYNNEATGERNMKEEYDQYCIPVFGNPFVPMGHGNQYSCDFLNVGSTNTSYVLLHEDRPRGAPECCVIGRPFHAPPPTFSQGMPIQWTDTVGDVAVDWFSVSDKDAGMFNYGFVSDATSSLPFAFYMKGVPWVANWMWQRFHNFTPIAPDINKWVVPDVCKLAEACPGW